MTTIAYRDGVLAADSQWTTETNRVYQYGQKLFRFPNGILYGGAGDDDDRKLRELIKEIIPPEVPDRSEVSECFSNVSGILVYPDGRVFTVDCELKNDKGSYLWMGSIAECTHPFVAIGSGEPYACGAMEAGATAVEAVKAAIKQDVFSGGKVNVLRLNNQEKKAKAAIGQNTSD